jgi:hypothetical protein
VFLVRVKLMVKTIYRRPTGPTPRTPRTYRAGAARNPPVRPADSYWESARRPVASLLLVAPLLGLYEVGCLNSGGAAGDSYRTGADAWIRLGLASLGWTSPWMLPLSVILILVGWQLAQGRSWSIPTSTLAAMVLESLVLAVALVGVSRLVDVAGGYLEPPGASLALNESGGTAAPPTIIGFLGAGIYEEFLFRLILIPLAFYGLRLVQMPQVFASALAVSGAGLLFSLAHHAGVPGEPFTWFAFVFRWFAGIAFGWIFVIRGFGIAVGTHTAYDILVGWFGWHF